MTIFFDITTSISWGGAQVGITRVEREIAKRAPLYATRPVRYCVYHAATGRYYALQPAFAEAILSGRWWVDLEVMRGLALSPKARRSASKFNLPHGLDPASTLAQLARRAAGYSLTEILELRQENPMAPVNTDEGVRLVSIGQMIEGPVPLSRNSWIINGGLDWEHKDIRHLRRMKAKTGFRYVAILYDIIPLLFPQYVVPFYVDLLKRYFGELFWTADYGLCISATTREDVTSHMARWRMPELKMADWPLGSDIPQSDRTTASVPKALKNRPFLLYVSTIEPRKSHRTIVDAFEYGIRHGLVPDDAMCVFVGRVGWNSENLVQEIKCNPLLADRILMMSGILDEELVELYHHARFVVFPSRYEGYGLSLVEAMALGKACISGDAGSLREVGGDAPEYIDPIDLPRWAQAIAKGFSDDRWIAKLEARSKSRYSPVTWDESARRFFAILNRWMDEAK